MQLMPGTAEQVSRRIGIDYSAASLTGDPSYNMLLGRTYLSRCPDGFARTYRAVAAYKAAPGNGTRWSGRSGDRGRGAVAILPWCTSSHVEETQNKVHGAHI